MTAIRRAATVSSDNIVASARASRDSAGAFRRHVERLRGISFEGSLTAAAEVRILARELAAGHAPREAIEKARAAVSARRGPQAPMMVAAE